MPSAQGLLIIVTALIFIASAGCVAQIGRLLSPIYGTRLNAHIGWRILLWLGAVVLIGRAVTLLFPGEAFEVHRMTPMVTLGGLVTLGLALWKLDDVMRENDPPPWSVQIMRLAAATGWTWLIARTAMVTPAATVGDEAPSDYRDPAQTGRLVIMIASGVVIAAVVAMIVLNSPAAAAI